MPTLLIADDSIFQRKGLGRIAQSLGYEVLEASDGHQCLDMLREHGPDAMLLDLNMPGLHGLDVLKAMREDGLSLPVVVISADIQETTRRRCMDLGARDILYKPFDQQTLHQVLGNLVG